MGDSYKAFEDWINGMTENQYESWLEDTATSAQEEKALNIRQPLEEDEEELMRQEQEYIPTTPQPREIEMPQQEQRQPQEIYDNRDLPPKVIDARVIIQEGQPPKVIPEKKPSIFRRIFFRQQVPKPTVPKEKKPSIFRRIFSFRRNKK